MKLIIASTLVAMTSVTGACVSFGGHKPASAVTPDQRLAILRRSQVWTPTRVAAMNVAAGPQGPGSFTRDQNVTCNWVERKLTGNSPKFACVIEGSNNDEVKVKFGVTNGEVYSEVAATRLFWALGFGSDRMYPVRVICHGCPADFDVPGEKPVAERVFDPAVIERKSPGWEVLSKANEGWSWKELDLVSAEAGGAPIAHRDALKLLAVMVQHGDSKAEQQRLVCLDSGPAPDAGSERAVCGKPFMLINDLGLTFGRADFINRNSEAGLNLARWMRTPVWKGDVGCVGNLSKTLTGSLGDPVISEEGRAFLSGLLMQLTDSQLQALFETARVTMRPSAPERAESAGTTVEQWVAAFKQKRLEINSRHCPRTPPGIV